jgi:hypothetical protein
MKKSVHISEANPSAREKFFHTLQEKIAGAKNGGNAVKNAKGK